MAGTFEVVGTFRVTGRGLVVYGDLLSGEVRNGDILVVPADDGCEIPFVIRSVEAMDGPDVSHVALVLSEDAPVPADIAGRTAIIQAP
jgi:GTPase